MRVGKSGVVQCDFCGKVIVGQADSVTRSGNSKHFCPGTCMDEYNLEHVYGTTIEDKVTKNVRAEYRFIHDRVCPACKFRLRSALDAPEDLSVCPECGTKLTCPNCGWES